MWHDKTGYSVTGMIWLGMTSAQWMSHSFICCVTGESIFWINDDANLFIISHFQNKSLPIENTTDCLSTLANLCRTMIENP